MEPADIAIGRRPGRLDPIAIAAPCFPFVDAPREPSLMTDTPADLQQKYKQLLELAPLATALAGLPPSTTRLFTEEQVEGRATTLRIAMRWAQSLADEASGGDPQKYRQMLDLLPITLALSGLPVSETRLFAEEQIEARAMTVRAAFRVARSTAREHLGGS